MQFDWMSSVIGFLLGAATGATGKYYADKYTDQRKRYELLKQRKKAFGDVKKQMPELIAEFKRDLSKDGNKLTREFFIVPERKMPLNSTKKRFVYYEEDHKDLQCKIDLLEERGFLVNVTQAHTPIYKMTEEFVELLNKYG